MMGSTCDSIGISGGCGIDCPVLQDYECPIHDEMIENLKEVGLKEELIDLGFIEDDFDPFDDAMEILK